MTSSIEDPPEKATTGSVSTLSNLSPANLHATLARLSRVLSTTSGQDSTLLFLNYSLLLVSTQLDALHLRFPFPKPPSNAAAPSKSPSSLLSAGIAGSQLKATSTSLKALIKVISDVRTFLRLFGLLGIYQWGVSTVYNPPADGVLKAIAYSQVLVNTIYQVLENTAYLSGKGVLNIDPKKVGKAWLWSSRCWMAHVVLDFIRLARVYQMRKKEDELLRSLEAGDEKAERERKKERRDEAKELWMRQLVVNMAYAPLTVHWSLEKGFVSDAVVGFLGTVAGVYSMKRAWGAAA